MSTTRTSSSSSQTKAKEENKIRVLRDAGFDMDLGGEDIVSVQYQNANNSVRVSDEFMRAVEAGTEFGLRAAQDRRGHRDRRRPRALRADHHGRLGVRRPRHPVRRHHQRLAHLPGVGPDHGVQPVFSEYMHLDNSSCNLASLNLLKFLSDDGVFDAATFSKAVEFVITAMDISICFADFPTQPIAETTRAFRQLGIGYANLGALLMATGHAYDSEGGRTLAAAITSLMQATAYRRSAELAAIVGPYDGYARNADAHKRVIRKHAAANDAVRPAGVDDAAGAQARVQGLGRDGRARRAQRLPQRAGQRARADRHHRPGDGLRHHRGGAGSRAGEVQEAGRRRLHADRQPDGAASV